jgi:hypothetical protein
MTADRIDTRDAYGDECTLLAGKALEQRLGSTVKAGVVAGMHVRETSLPAWTEDGAVEVASFLAGALSPKARLDLLEEVAPGLAGAARRVAEAAAHGRFQCWSEAEQALLDALVAELNKLEGGT